MQETSSEPRHYRGYRIFPALAVIAIGVIFLARNLGVEIPFLDSTNWWAWFILIAALSPLTNAYEMFRARGHVDAGVAHSLLNAAAIILVGVMFLLGLDWQVWWPLFVILGGFFALGRRSYRGVYWYRRRDRYRSRHWSDDPDDASFKR